MYLLYIIIVIDTYFKTELPWLPYLVPTILRSAKYHSLLVKHYLPYPTSGRGSASSIVLSKFLLSLEGYLVMGTYSHLPITAW